MAVTYKKLFHLMIDKNISNAELMENLMLYLVKKDLYGESILPHLRCFSCQNADTL